MTTVTALAPASAAGRSATCPCRCSSASWSCTSSCRSGGSSSTAPRTPPACSAAATRCGSPTASTTSATCCQLFTYDGGIYGRWILNSALYALAGGVGATILAVLAGYGFAKYRFAGRRFGFALVLGALMVPATALVIPTFVMFAGLGLTNTIWAVILPSLLNPFGVYLMHVYARDAVPDEILDAARADGAGELRVFLQVALPLMRPAVVTVLLLSAVACWNNYFLPLAMLSDNRLFPVTVGLGLWQGIASANNAGTTPLWSLIILGALVSVIPLDHRVLHAAAALARRPRPRRPAVRRAGDARPGVARCGRAGPGPAVRAAAAATSPPTARARRRARARRTRAR